MPKTNPTKIYSNIPEVTDALNKLHYHPTKIVIGEKSYNITKQETIQRGTGEIIGRRLLGGFLVALSFGALYFHNQQVRELFETKYIRVTAIPDETPIANAAKKAGKAASLIQNKEEHVPPSRDQPVLKLNPAKDDFKKKKPKPMSDDLIDRLVRHPISKSEVEQKQSPYLALPSDPRKEIESYLSIEELLLLSEVSRGTKRTVEESLTTDIRQIEIFVKLFLKKEVSSEQFKRFVKNSPATGLLNKLLSVLNTPNQLNEDFLKKLPPNVIEPFLKAFLEIASDLSASQDLYKKFASHQTKFALVLKLDEHVGKALSLSLYENWADELRKGVNFKNEKEKNAFYKLLFNIIIPPYLNRGTYITTDLRAYPVIDQQMPDLSLSELSKETMSRMDFRLPDVAPSLAAYRALELCNSLDGDDLRNKFNALYHEGIKAYHEGIEASLAIGWSGKWGVEDSKDAFCAGLYGLLKAVDFPEDLVRKVVYAINGTAKFSKLQVKFMARLYRWSGLGPWKSKHETAVIPALEEFARSHRDTAFKPVFHAPFPWIDRTPEVSALIRGVKKFEEPARSLYLRAIVYGIHSNTGILSIDKLSSDQITEAFANSEVAFPKGGIVYELEFIKYASSLSPFIKKVNDIKNKEDFTTVLKEILSLPSVPSSKLMKARLQVLAQGTEFLDFKTTYLKCNLPFPIDQLTILTKEEFGHLDSQFRHSLMRVNSNMQLRFLILKNKNNLLELRALCNHVYHLFENSRVPLEERQAIFTENGLNIEDYGSFDQFDQKKWLKIEEKDFFQEI